MNRLDFYEIAQVNGVNELDFMNSNLAALRLKRSITYYRVTTADLGMPDNISYKVYGDESFWWLICLVNGILNPFTDLVEGALLAIPSILDLYDFRKLSAKR